MKKIRTQIYVKAYIERNGFVYSGIEFIEFIKYLSQPIENLMMITGGSNAISIDTRFERRLELFEGVDLIGQLTRENLYNLGDFCFVDYLSPNQPSQLSEEQIAELLYLGHMFEPLHSPFFEELQNRFVYLAHDDGWYGKLYSKNFDDFITVLCSKIVSRGISYLSDSFKNKLLSILTEGIIIDLEESCCRKAPTDVNIYVVGAYANMDEVLNNFAKIKAEAKQRHRLAIVNENWSLE